VHDKTARMRTRSVCVLSEAAQADSDNEDGAGAGSERNGHRSRIRTVTRTHFASPPHGQGTQGCQFVARGVRRTRQISGAGTPLVRALALHGVSGEPRKPLGLNP
jgi:hypothetical protein